MLGRSDDAAFFAAHYDVTPEGNFEGHNILNRLKHLPRSMEDEKRLAPMRDKLLAARADAGPARPRRQGAGRLERADDRRARECRLAFDEPDWLEMAARAFLFIDAKMTHGDRLGHSWREGKLLLPGLASDHAAMIRAALALHEATGRAAYLERALAWQGTLDRHYANPATGGYFLTADDAEGLVVRPSATTDDATPNPNALAAQNLIRLAVFTGQHAWRDQADRLFDGIVATAGDNLFAHLALAQRPRPALARRRDRGGRKRRTRGRPARRRPQAALSRSHRAARASPTHCRRRIRPSRRSTAAAQSAAFVCVGETCSLPVTEPDTLAETVSAVRPRPTFRLRANRIARETCSEIGMIPISP